MDEIVCEICGSSSDREFMANCVQCNAYKHRYCLPVVAFEIHEIWYCDECQKKADGDPRSFQGGQTVSQRPLHGCDLTMERITPMKDNNHMNMIHQTDPKTPKKNAKVKFISLGEVASLSKEKPAYYRSNCAAQRTFSQVRPASPPNVKHSSMKCISPSRSDIQVGALKRCAVASQNPPKIVDINMKQKARSGAAIPMVRPCSTSEAAKGKNDQQIQEEPTKKRVVSEHIGKINSRIQDKPREQSAFNASALIDADIGCESGIKTLHNIDMPVVISSSVEYARRPPPPSCWTGCFRVFDGSNCNLGEFNAYFPSKVSPEVRDITKKMPNNLQLEILPRMNDWPKVFNTIHPVYEDIGLVFFSSELDCCEKKHPHLLETFCNFVMKAYIDDVKLLIYSSDVLPPDSQWIDGKSYLWGIFVKSEGRSNPVRFGSIAT